MMEELCISVTYGVINIMGCCYFISDYSPFSYYYCYIIGIQGLCKSSLSTILSCVRSPPWRIILLGLGCIS